MTFEFYYVLSIVVVVSIILGIDTAKPCDGMCQSCMRKDCRVTNIRIGLITPFLVIGMTRVIAVVLLYHRGDLPPFGVLAAISVACSAVALLLYGGRRFGQRFQDNIWVPA